MAAPIITFVGKSGVGKTTLLEKVIAALKSRGYRVGTIKHHTHSNFDIDIPGKDSWRHAQAGSDHVIIVAPEKVASIRKPDHELTLDEAAAEMTDVDIILVEGYKQAGKPTIEVVRKEHYPKLMCDPKQIVALVTDGEFPIETPHFGLNDVEGVVGFLVERYM